MGNEHEKRVLWDVFFVFVEGGVEGVGKVFAVRVSEEDNEQTKHTPMGVFCVFIMSEKKPNTKNMPTRVCFSCSL